jgi:hypothetical protein
MRRPLTMLCRLCSVAPRCWPIWCLPAPGVTTRAGLRWVTGSAVRAGMACRWLLSVRGGLPGTGEKTSRISLNVCAPGRGRIVSCQLVGPLTGALPRGAWVPVGLVPAEARPGLPSGRINAAACRISWPVLGSGPQAQPGGKAGCVYGRGGLAVPAQGRPGLRLPIWAVTGRVFSSLIFVAACLPRGRGACGAGAHVGHRRPPPATAAPRLEPTGGSPLARLVLADLPRSSPGNWSRTGRCRRT